MRYYIGKDGQRLGPFDAGQVREQLNAGLLAYEDLVWREGMANWAPLRTEFPPLTPPPVPPPGVTTASPFAGQTPPGTPSASTLPATRPNAAPSTAQDTGPLLAERGRRLIAASIDHLLVLLCLIPGLVRFTPLFLDLWVKAVETNQVPDEAVIERMLADSFGPWAFLLLIAGVLQMALLSLRGQTLGKLFCRIRIVKLDGSPAGFLHAFVLRALVIGFISGVPVLGWMIAVIDILFIFRDDRRCLHDHIAGTAVVDA